MVVQDGEQDSDRRRKDNDSARAVLIHEALQILTENNFVIIESDSEKWITYPLDRNYWSWLVPPSAAVDNPTIRKAVDFLLFCGVGVRMLLIPQWAMELTFPVEVYPPAKPGSVR